MATGPIETHLHRSFNWENGAPGPQEGPRGRSANCGSEPSAQCVRLRSEINLLRKLCEYKGIEIIEGHLMPDHVHVLLAIPPKHSVASVMGYLKGKSSLMIFDRHANLKYKFGNRKFWAEGYYVSTVGLNEATIAKYIREQESHDIALDKLSVREYEDPFKRR